MSSLEYQITAAYHLFFPLQPFFQCVCVFTEARVLFKDLVNKVAVVSNESNGKYLNLRPNYGSDVGRPSSIASASSMISIGQEHPLVTNITVNSAEKLSAYNNRIQSVNSIDLISGQQQSFYNSQPTKTHSSSPYHHQQQQQLSQQRMASSQQFSNMPYNGSPYQARDSQAVSSYNSSPIHQGHQGHHLSSLSLSMSFIKRFFNLGCFVNSV